MMISSVRRTVAILIAVVWGILASTQALAQFPVYWVPVSGDYNNGNNWSDEPAPLIGRGAIPDGPSLGEFASISHDGTAIVSSVIGTNPGGVVLGELAGGTGTLNITAGSLTSVAVPPSNTGNVEVGRAGRGYLNASGGTLTAPGLTVGGEDLATGAGRSAANFSGSAVVNINGAASFTRNLMVTGPSVNFAASGSVSLSATNIYTPVITGATHSPIKSNGGLTVGGNLNVQFSGAVPTVGQSWTLFDGATVGGVFANEGTGRTVFPTAGVTPPVGAAFRLRNQAGGLGQQMQLLYESVLVLDVNRDTGNLTIANPLNGSYAIDGYTVSSTNGSLVTSWAGLGQAGWEKAGATANGLSEIKMTAGAGLPVTSAQSRNLGTGFSKLAGAATDITGLGGTAEDLIFQYTLPGEQSVRTGQIRYTGTQYTDNLTVFVDPSGDARLKNDSNLSLSLDGYQLQSSTGAFTPGSWTGIDGPGGTWLQGPGASGTASALVETRPSGPVVLAPGATFNLGDIGTFATAEARAGVSMQFILDPTFHSGSVPGDYSRNGIVDAADYTLWRNLLGTGGTLANRNPANTGNIVQADYDFWKSNFGSTTGTGGNPADLFRNGTIVFVDAEFAAGSGSLVGATVPEPASGGLLLLGLGGLLGVWQRRRSSHESNYATYSQGAPGTVRRYVAMLKPTLCPVSVVGGILVALGLAMPAQSQVLTSSIVNPNFDDSITAKTEWWDATGAIVMPNPIVGWETTGPGADFPGNLGGPVAGPGDSGIEQAGVGGSWALYLSSPDPAAIQTTSHNIVSGRNYILSFQLSHVFTSTGIAASEVSFYYQDGANRVPLGNQQFTQTAGAFTPQTLMLTAAQMAAGVGHPLGIEFETISGATAIGGKDNNSWYRWDNLQLVAAGGIGDVNTNGTTDMADFEVIRQNMLSGLTGWTNGDINGDTLIDLRDFRQWTQDPAVAGSGLAAIALQSLGVPEPSTGALALLSAAAIAGIFRRRGTGGITVTGRRNREMYCRVSVVSKRWIGLVGVVLACVFAHDSLAAGLSMSASAPAGPYLASQLTDDTGAGEGNRNYTDNGGPPGQTFQVSNSGMASRFTIKGLGSSSDTWDTGVNPWDGNEFWGIQIAQVDAGTGALTVLASETATGFTADGATNILDYLTFTLDTPVSLNPGTTYAFSVALWSEAGPFNNGGWFGLAHSATDVYPSGVAFNNNTSINNPNDNTGAARYGITVPGFAAPVPGAYDYVFAVQGQAVVTVPGDTNNDGQVNLLDYNNIRDHFRTTVPTGTNGDIHSPSGGPNGFVDLWDFAEWKENRTDLGAGSGSIVGVPEPASYVLLVTAATLVAGRRRRAANRKGS